MAQRPSTRLFGFHCCPDPTLGDPVNEFRKNGVKGLMTESGLEFIKNHVRNNDVRLQVLCLLCVGIDVLCR